MSELTKIIDKLREGYKKAVTDISTIEEKERYSHHPFWHRTLLIAKNSNKEKKDGND